MPSSPMYPATAIANDILAQHTPGAMLGLHDGPIESTIDSTVAATVQATGLICGRAQRCPRW